MTGCKVYAIMRRVFRVFVLGVVSKHGGSGRVVYCYARALLDIVADSADRVCDEVEQLAAAFSDGGVHSFFANPVIDKGGKIEAVRAMGKSCRLNEGLVNCVCAIVSDGRFTLLLDVFKEFVALVQRMQGKFKLEVTTASVPSSAEQERILKIVASECNGEPGVVVWKVDPEVLGGFVAKAGSLLIDASFSGHLRELERISRNAIYGV
ncbi:MAG: ATP synthase F1 subunit delta [Anaplasma sp.]